MKLRFLEDGGNASTEGILRVVLCLLALSNRLAAAPVDDEFPGADEKKIREPPKYLKVCHKSDKNIDKCIQASLEKLLENVNSGSEEMSLPTMDPIEVPLVEFELGSGNVSLHLTFKRFTVTGFKHLLVTNVKSNVNDNKFEISIECPKILLNAEFAAEGGVFTFPISGQGDFYLNMTDVSAVVIFRLKTSELLGMRFFLVEDAIMDLLPREISAHFGDFIDGSNAIGTAFNTFFNQNSLEIFTIIKPKLSGIFAEIFASFANDILGRQPEDVLLPD